MVRGKQKRERKPEKGETGRKRKAGSGKENRLAPPQSVYSHL